MLTQQADRIDQVATGYWRSAQARRGAKLAELGGAVQVLLDLADPAGKGVDNRLYEELASAPGATARSRPSTGESRDSCSRRVYSLEGRSPKGVVSSCGQ